MRTAVLLLAAVSLCSGESFTSVRGQVTDASGAVLTDARLSVVNEGTGARRSGRTSDAGEYAIGGLRPGLYKITVRKPGFSTVSRLRVPLHASGHRVDFVLQIGTRHEVVVVEGTPPVINADDATVALPAPRSLLLDALPVNGRGLLSLIELAPGVVATPATTGEAGQFSANGQRPNTNYFTVDGVTVNAGLTTGGGPSAFAGATLPAMTAFGGTQNLAQAESIDELRIETSTFAPEHGRMPGAQIAVLTRTGSNDIHGSALYAARHEALSANDWFANRRGLERARLRQHHWSGTVGGPLRRDRTFAFAALEGMRLRQPYFAEAAVPTEAVIRSVPRHVQPLLRAFPAPNGPDLDRATGIFAAQVVRPARLDSGSLRIDHTFSPRHTMWARYMDAPSSGAVGVARVDRSDFGYRSFTIGFGAAITPTILSDLRVGRSMLTASSVWETTNLGGAAPVDLARFFPLPGTDRFDRAVYAVGIGGLGRLVQGTGGSTRQGQWNAVESLSVTTGPHQLRFGADYMRMTPERETSALSAAGVFASIDHMVRGMPMLTTWAEASQASSLIETVSLYAQDSWRVRPWLTLTWGTRWEFTPSPAVAGDVLRAGDTTVLLPGTTAPPELLPQGNATRLWRSRYRQFAPRAGAAVRLPGDAVLRAGWGLFYDLGFSLATDPINAFPFNQWQFGGLSPAAPGGSLYGYRFSDELRMPYSMHWNVSLERPLGSTGVVSAAWVGSAGRSLLRREGLALSDAAIAQAAVATNNGESDYNALQLGYRRTLARNLNGLVSWTWSHAIDNGSWDSGVYLVGGGFDARRDRGSASFDVRHSVQAAATYDAPWGLRLHSTLRARTGFPVDVMMNENLLGIGFDNAVRPDLVPGVPVWLTDAAAPGGGRLNAAAFRAPAAGRQGNLGRNAIRGFGMAQVDLAVDREFAAWGESVLQVRLEAFNVANGAGFADPVRFLNSPLFGVPTSMLNQMLGTGSPSSGMAPLFQSGGPRMLQVALRYRF